MEPRSQLPAARGLPLGRPKVAHVITVFDHTGEDGRVADDALKWRLTRVLGGLAAACALCIALVARACSSALGATGGGGLLGSDRYWAPPVAMGAGGGQALGQVRAQGALAGRPGVVAARPSR